MKIRSILIVNALAILCLAVSLRAQTPTPTPAPTATPAGYISVFKPSPTPNALPLAIRQAQVANQISQALTANETQLLNNFAALYRTVWSNPAGLTPQQVCDALGPKADNLFVIAGTMANAIYQIDPVALGSMINPPAGYTVTGNPNGTVTITYTAPAGH